MKERAEVNWSDYQGSMGSSSYYPSLAQTPATTSAEPDFNEGRFGNSQLDDSSYESENDVICTVHSASTSTMSSQSANTVICTVLALDHKTYFTMEASSRAMGS